MTNTARLYEGAPHGLMLTHAERNRRIGSCLVRLMGRAGQLFCRLADCNDSCSFLLSPHLATDRVDRRAIESRCDADVVPARAFLQPRSGLSCEYPQRRVRAR